MLWAAKHGNVPAVKALLESGEDVNRWIRLAVVERDIAPLCTSPLSMATQR